MLLLDTRFLGNKNITVLNIFWDTDTLPLDQHHWHRQTDDPLSPCMLTDMGSVDRMLPMVSVWGVMPSSRTVIAGAKRCCDSYLLQKAFTWLVVGARWPGHQVSLDVHWRHSIMYDAMFAISDKVSHCISMPLLIFHTASIKLCFVMCCQTPSLFTPLTLSR